MKLCILSAILFLNAPIIAMMQKTYTPSQILARKHILNHEHTIISSINMLQTVGDSSAYFGICFAIKTETGIFISIPSERTPLITLSENEFNTFINDLSLRNQALQTTLK